MSRHIITFAIVLAAVVLYVKGFSQLSAALVVAGLVLETWFWVRLVRASPAPDAPRIER